MFCLFVCLFVFSTDVDQQIMTAIDHTTHLVPIEEGLGGYFDIQTSDFDDEDAICISNQNKLWFLDLDLDHDHNISRISVVLVAYQVSLGRVRIF